MGNQREFQEAEARKPSAAEHKPACLCVQRCPPAKPLTSYLAAFAADPHPGVALAYLSGNYPMKAIAQTFGVHYTTVSRALRAHEARRDNG